MTGIVLTGGGAQIKNLPQLVSFITAKETRIGYPNEHLANDSKDKVTSPMFSTGVGLVLKGFEKYYKEDNSIAVSVDDSDEGNKENQSKGGFLETMKNFFDEDIN